MKKIIFFIVMILFSFGKSNEIKANSEYEKIAMEMLQSITSGNFEKATENFDEYVSKALPHQKLEAVWNQLQTAYGKFVSISDFSKTEEVGNRILIVNHIIFEKDSLKSNITIAQNKETNKLEVAGFYFLPITPEKMDYIDAEYVNKSKFEEIEITLPPDSILKGKLTIPINLLAGQKVPCIVLVHGSGAHDFDETLYTNKVFRDIAYGLSSNGIAVLRYNKRTFVDKNLDIQNLTLNEETVFDAVEAVNFLKKNYPDRIGKVYVLGHSLGGYAMPRIANLSKNADGFICLAGLARSLGDVLVEQYEYLFELNKQDAETQEAKDYIDTLKKVEIAKAKRIQKKNFNENIPLDSLPLGFTIKYLQDLHNYEPVKEFAKEKRPILFLQGGRDYQVTVEDFNLWKKGLGKKSNCRFILFDNLNHLLQSGTGKSKPAEYFEKKNVDKQVIDEIVNWVNGIK